MIRKIIRIDSDKCNGCGLCVTACHEGAIGMEGGKAVLLRDDYCDGLGDCLPVCPTNAISFEQREALEYNEAEVKRNMAMRSAQPETLACGCPGTLAAKIGRGCEAKTGESAVSVPSQLNQWPVQIKLVPVSAPYFSDADILVAADCTAFAYGNFHSDFIRDKITLIGCPKLDDADYREKLGAILKGNSVKSVTVTRMEVPCCGGIEFAVKAALKESGKNIPLRVVTISTDGKILEDEAVTI